MKDAPAKPRKPSAADIGKLVSAARIQMYELTPANAIPTVAKLLESRNTRERRYLLTIAE